MAEMDNLFDSPSSLMSDSLSLKQTEPGKVDVFFRAVPRLALDGEGVDDTRPPVRILHADVVAGHLTMFPTNNLTRPLREVRPKYSRIERISFVGGQVVYVSGSESLGQDEVDGRFLGSYFGKTEPVPLAEGEQIPELEDTVPMSVGDVMNLLEGLPDYCVKDPQYGLGVQAPV